MASGSVTMDASPARSAAARPGRRPLLPRVRTANGGGWVERPITPATAMIVRTYGSASKSVETESEVLLQALRERAREAEQEACDRSAERPPVSEDERRERDEATPRGLVRLEAVHEAEREVHAAPPRRGLRKGSPPRSG